MMRFSLLLTLFIACAATANADIIWLSESYDFGTIREAAGPTEGSVRFVNTGPDTTIINRVRPSCGCTGERHTEGLIAPGDTATVWFIYNPKGRPGKFAKTVKIYTGVENSTKSIPITGTVIGEPTSLEPDYPIVAKGGLRISADTLNFGQINYGHIRHLFLKGYNQSPDTLRPATRVLVADAPVEAIVSSKTVAPGDIFSISFYFNSRSNALLGASTYPVEIIDSANPDASPLTINVSADVIPASANLTPEQLASAPMLELPETVVNAEIKKGKATFRIPIRNTGASDLQILRIYSRAPEVKITKLPVRLHKGHTGYAEGEISIDNIAAPAFAFFVEILTTDPRLPVARVRIAGQTGRP